jgi:hypothetical protein
MPAAQLHVAIGAEQRNSRGAHLAGRELQQTQAGLIGPVQVVEKHHQRPLATRVVEEAHDAVEEPEAGLLRLARVGLGEIGKALPELGNQRGHIGRACSEPLAQPRCGHLRHDGA